jgi:hypothetical protein
MMQATTASNSGAQILAADSGIGQGTTAATAFDPNDGWFGYWSTWGNQTIAGGLPVNILGVWAQLATAHAFTSLGEDIGPGLADGAAALASVQTRLVSAVGAAGSSLAPRATLGVGISLGHLTMPPATVGMLGSAQPPVQLASAVSALPPGGAQPPMLPMAPMRPGRGASGGRRRKGRDYDDIEYGAELPGTVMHRPPSAG